MRRSSVAIVGIIALLLSPLEAYLLYNGILIVLGYEFTESPEQLAVKLIEEGRPSEGCSLFRTMDIGPRPTTKELQGRCVYEYAAMTMDARDCEPWLLSDYGMSCLSTVGGKVAKGQECIVYFGGTVSCSGENLGLDFIAIDNPQISNCSLYTRRDLREWCHARRTGRLKGIYECDSISTQLTKDLCQEYYAFKEKDPSLCAPITQEKHRIYCEIRINTWLNYPELRDSFYFGKKVPIDG